MKKKRTLACGLIRETRFMLYADRWAMLAKVLARAMRLNPELTRRKTKTAATRLSEELAEPARAGGLAAMEELMDVCFYAALTSPEHKDQAELAEINLALDKVEQMSDQDFESFCKLACAKWTAPNSGRVWLRDTFRRLHGRQRRRASIKGPIYMI